MTSVDETKDLTVFYDGACPLCRREIAFYQDKTGADAIAWIDVSGQVGNDEVAPGLSRDRALSRFHIVDGNGTVVSGGRAFAAIWTSLPGFRPLGWLFRLRPFAWGLDHAYDLFLHVRPRLQALVAGRHAARAGALPPWLVRELRSDHAGEAGAVAIYRGILMISRDAEVRRFAEAHLETERGHLRALETVLPKTDRTVFLSLWRLAGGLTGLLPALFGPRPVFATIEAVETFVDRHYAGQVDRLTREGTHADLRNLLEQCRLEEVSHRDEARESGGGPPGPISRLWCNAIGVGSSLAVAIARRL